MQFYFIRHAQSSNNFLYDTTGSSVGRSEDPELTEVGYHQAELLARFLARGNPVPTDRLNRSGFGITHLYTSLMVRAVATATIIARELALAPVGWEELHEGGGIYLEDPETGEKVGQPGKTRAYFATHYPELVLPATFNDDGWWNRPFEEYEQVFPRAERFLNDLLTRHGNTEDRVAVVSHGGFYNVLMQTIFKIGRANVWFHLNNAAITRIDFLGEEIVLVYANRTDFLPNDLIT
jgi:2,3-bisphosphoglycerate-dependent phosphoglycerate mutase